MVQILKLLAALALLSASLSAQNIHWAQILSGDRQGSGTKGLSNALTSAHFFVGNGSNVATDVALSGDASVTNAGAWTNVKLNGVSFAASPSTNTVPIITASNTATYSTVPDCQDSAGNHLNYNNTTHALSCGTSTSGLSTTLTSAHFFIGNVSNLATDVALSGDASVTNAGVWTNAKVNGVSFAASPSTNTVPIITASNTATYTSVPDCQDSAGNHLNYNNSTHALSCGSTGSSSSGTHSIGATFDGGGSALTTGTKAYVTVPYACTISAWNMTVDTGTATVDAWKIATGTAIPTIANTITASATPAISTGTALHSTTLTAWTTSVTANDIFAFDITAVATATKVSLALQCQ